MTISSGRLPAGPRIRRRNIHLASAGQILGVGLVCFALWLFFDARQLYQSATTSPLGTRRTVAMTILRPVARIEEFLGLDRIENAANRILGKTGTPGGSAISPTTPSTTLPPVRGKGSSGAGKSTSTTSAAGVHKQAPPRVLQPSPSHILTVLDVGDSIGEDLGIGLTDVLGNAPNVRLIDASVGDTGLANLGYYNWLAQLPVDIAKYHPQAVVIMLGGNDGQSFQNGNAVIQFGTPAWHTVYSQRVAELMSEATAGGARVIWVGLPLVGPTADLSNTDITEQNAVYATQAKTNPAVTFVSSVRLFETPTGQYATYLSIPGQGRVQVRDADEVHIDPPGGTDLLASYVVKQMDSVWKIKIG